jgi:hypothetical protein
MVWIGRLPAADQTRLGGDIFQMRFITQPSGLGDRQNTFIDLSGRQSERDRLKQLGIR